MYIHILINMHLYTNFCECVYVFIHTHTNTLIYIYIYIHSHIHTPFGLHVSLWGCRYLFQYACVKSYWLAKMYIHIDIWIHTYTSTLMIGLRARHMDLRYLSRCECFDSTHIGYPNLLVLLFSFSILLIFSAWCHFLHWLRHTFLSTTCTLI